MMRAFRVLSLVALLAVGSAVSAMAVEVDFGILSPSPGGCTHSGTDPGYVCTSPQTFSASGATFTATGFDNPFAPGGDLTFSSRRMEVPSHRQATLSGKRGSATI
jgi:hypothetical protein